MIVIILKLLNKPQYIRMLQPPHNLNLIPQPLIGPMFGHVIRLLVHNFDGILMVAEDLDGTKALSEATAAKQVSDFVLAVLVEAHQGFLGLVLDVDRQMGDLGLVFLAAHYY